MTAIIMRLAVGPLLLAALLAGCASGPGNGPASNSSNGGQGQQTPAASQDVTVIGNVTRQVIPWRDGLTLMQAFGMSGYQNDANPRQLGIIRKKQMPVYVDYQKLYEGQDLLLEPGDQIQIIP
jgi:hypothetical protein